jgi:hypothetical protein
MQNLLSDQDDSFISMATNVDFERSFDMKQFKWKARIRCIYRIFVLTKCFDIDLNKAISQAVGKRNPQTGEYYFCENPECITDRQFFLLRRDSAAYIEITDQRAKGVVKQNA